MPGEITEKVAIATQIATRTKFAGDGSLVRTGTAGASDNVSKACKVMGLSRDTFYRHMPAAKEKGRHMLGAGRELVLEWSVIKMPCDCGFLVRKLYRNCLPDHCFG